MSYHGTGVMSLYELARVRSLSQKLGVDLEELAEIHMRDVHGSKTGKTEMGELIDVPVVLTELSEHIMHLVDLANEGKELSFPTPEGSLRQERLG